MRQTDILEYLKSVYPAYKSPTEVVHGVLGEVEYCRRINVRASASNKIGKLVRCGLVERKEFPDRHVGYRWIPEDVQEGSE